MRDAVKVVVGLCALTCSWALHAQGADTLLINANIYQHPQAQALAIKDGKILDIGSNVDMAIYRENATHIVDIENAFVMPGFIDNHNHVFEAASPVGGGCELASDATLLDQVPYLKKCRREDQTKGWIIGYGFTIDSILESQAKMTPLEVIDSIFPDQPIIIMEQSSTQCG